MPSLRDANVTPKSSSAASISLETLYVGLGFVGGADAAAVSALSSLRAFASLGVWQGARSASVASGAFVSVGCFSLTFPPDILKCASEDASSPQCLL